MKISLQLKISNTKNYYNYFKDNSFFIKDLNRSEQNYKIFDEFIKNKYTLKISDKISKSIDNIDNISNVLSMLK